MLPEVEIGVYVEAVASTFSSLTVLVKDAGKSRKKNRKEIGNIIELMSSAPHHILM